MLQRSNLFNHGIVLGKRNGDRRPESMRVIVVIFFVLSILMEVGRHPDTPMDVDAEFFLTMVIGSMGHWDG
ncbi:hypothetical protein ZOSMA_41G00170 [Zostera marina]|uniref:Uncharacterized protein n=1 Tax=Zostera marina TaxID=29655 RepID=A0A0K9P2I6_ZOSMR|nr:hypothetical protein ZOSMA_41G00170 [Zostera marina]